MNETPEQTARALFIRQFVDFDPAGAKAGRRRRGESMPDLFAELHGLFPDRLTP